MNATNLSLTTLKLSLLAAVALMAGCAADGSDTSEPEGATDEAIVGGAATAAYPAVGALTQADGFVFCTGTVVAPRVVITAAHCLAEPGTTASGVRFALGPNGNSPTSVIKVKRIKYHPQYDAKNIKNDIGVVILAEDAPVKPMAMNTEMPSSWKGKSLTFVGYGVTNGKTQTGAGLKRQVSIPISEVDDTQFAYDTKGKNTCNGDSGGPAIVKDSNGDLAVAGVTSYGDQGCVKFGVDTRVDAFVDFVNAVPTN